jgi:5'-deoxynucleotidase YfbR-like HD superfamily hydrolase
MGQEAAPGLEQKEVAQEDKKQKQQHKRSIEQAHNAAGTTKISRENIMAWCVWKNYLQGEKLVTGRNEDMTVVYVSNKDDNVIMQVADDYTRMLQEAAYEGFQQEMCQYRQDLLKGLSLRVAKQKYESTDQFRAVKTFNQKLSQAGLSTKPSEVCSLYI